MVIIWKSKNKFKNNNQKIMNIYNLIIIKNKKMTNKIQIKNKVNRHFLKKFNRKYNRKKLELKNNKLHCHKKKSIMKIRKNKMNQYKISKINKWLNMIWNRL